MLLLRAIVEKAADVLDTVLETALTPGVPLPGHWKLSTHVGSLVTESTAGQFGQFHSADGVCSNGTKSSACVDTALQEQC